MCAGTYPLGFSFAITQKNDAGGDDLVQAVANNYIFP
jgi:hypothetical protein